MICRRERLIGGAGRRRRIRGVLGEEQVPPPPRHRVPQHVGQGLTAPRRRGLEPDGDLLGVVTGAAGAAGAAALWSTPRTDALSNLHEVAPAVVGTLPFLRRRRRHRASDGGYVALHLEHQTVEVRRHHARRPYRSQRGGRGGGVGGSVGVMVRGSVGVMVRGSVSVMVRGPVSVMVRDSVGVMVRDSVGVTVCGG